MGVPVAMLPELFWLDQRREGWSAHELWDVRLRDRKALAATRNMLAILLPNDILFGPGLMHVDLAKRIWEIWDTLGNARHITLRDPGLTAEPSGKTVQAGLYLKENGRAMLVVGNLSAEPRTIKILSAADLLPLAGMRVDDILDAKPASLAGQTITLDVGAKDFRLVLLKRESSSQPLGARL